MKLKGYITVEASMVVPVVMFVTITMLYLCFYIHDRVIIHSYSYVLCFHEDSEEEYEKMKNRIKKSLIASELKETERKKHRISVESGISVLTDLKALVHLKEYKESKVELTGTGKRNQVWMIRFMEGFD